jgi:hypothetical protein
MSFFCRLLLFPRQDVRLEFRPSPRSCPREDQVIRIQCIFRICIQSVISLARIIKHTQSNAKAIRDVFCLGDLG